MELIDKNKLLEELKKLKHNLSASPIVVIEDVESLVESFKVKEVNLEKEIDEVWDTDYEDFGIPVDDFYRITRHFFKLGLEAQKGGEV